MRLAKRKAAEEGRPLSDLIQDALVQYLEERCRDAQRTQDRVSSVLRTSDEDTSGAASPSPRRRHLGFMNLDDIPSGSLCVIDTNILIYAEQRASLQAQRLLRRIEEPGRYSECFRNLCGKNYAPADDHRGYHARAYPRSAILLGSSSSKA